MEFPTPPIRKASTCLTLPPGRASPALIRPCSADATNSASKSPASGSNQTVRRTLHTGAGLLTDRQKDRLAVLFAKEAAVT